MSVAALWANLLYMVAIALAFAPPWASLLLYALVALMWRTPDRRIESRITQSPRVITTSFPRLTLSS